MAEDAGYPVPMVLDAVAVAPAVASATLTLLIAVTVCDRVALVDVAFEASPTYRATMP